MEIIKKFSSMSNQINISNYMGWRAPINHLAPPLLSLCNTEKQADAVCGPPSPHLLAVMYSRALSTFRLVKVSCSTAENKRFTGWIIILFIKAKFPIIIKTWRYRYMPNILYREFDFTLFYLLVLRI